MGRSKVRESRQIGHVILIYAISQSCSRAIHQNPGHGLDGDIEHVVANPSTVGKSGQVSADNTKPILTISRSWRDPHVQAQHLARNYIGRLIEPRDSCQKHLHQVIARGWRNLDSEKQVEKPGEFRVGDETEELPVIGRTRRVESILHS